MRLLRTIRLDESDLEVYGAAAEPGEWAVPGSFVFTFSQEGPEALSGKMRQAFQHGFLGLGSFGWATLVMVEDITMTEYRQAVERLAHHFVEHYGAPSMEAALEEARKEVGFASSLCEHPPQTLLSVQRRIDGRGVVEQFSKHEPRVAWEAQQPIALVPGEPEP